ncbi:DinB family protein [Paracoccus alkanivorans]|uniref:Damage-inducible protein DinB n=1 Tax=Paracoccus alkanivorans TaxID=2116655 RepID=A0A3M0MGB5_9RHOB|nr:DinB family protein [Paracoccus alkanivorans]RMC36455.1 damage-inducible protein DinB [Paracoccus alkanivorans]
MPNREYALAMARYNLWQNENLLNAADGLSPEERARDRGAFFGSIHKTFSHVLWGDMMWMSRFAGTARPPGGLAESVGLADDWPAFREKRRELDELILQWAHEVPSEWFEGELNWFSGAIGRELSKPKKMLVLQMFNHQTHHRGQIHAMLTAAGIKPGDTDVPLMPEHYLNL